MSNFDLFWPKIACFKLVIGFHEGGKFRAINFLILTNADIKIDSRF